MIKNQTMESPGISEMIVAVVGDASECVYLPQVADCAPPVYHLAQLVDNLVQFVYLHVVFVYYLVLGIVVLSVVHQTRRTLVQCVEVKGSSL